MNNKWNGRTFSLEKFTGIHRSAFVQMQEANDHVDSDLQLPSEHTRVGYLLDNNYNFIYTLDEALTDWMKDCPEEW